MAKLKPKYDLFIHIIIVVHMVLPSSVVFIMINNPFSSRLKSNFNNTVL